MIVDKIKGQFIISEDKKGTLSIQIKYVAGITICNKNLILKKEEIKGIRKLLKIFDI